MSNLSDKVEAVQRLAAGYRAVLELADELGGIASLDARKDELEAQVKAAQGALADASERVARARDEASDVQAQSLADAARAQEHADQVRTQAADAARNRNDAAQAEADALIASARAAADKTRSSAASAAAAVREAALAAKEKIEAEAVLAAGRLAELESGVIAAGAQLDELNAKIEQARSVIANFQKG